MKGGIKMKRFQRFAVICAACTLMTGAAAVLPEYPASAASVRAAAQYTDDGVLYTMYADHAEISGYQGENAAVAVPETVQGLPVTAVADGAFSGTLVRHVELPETVRRIGTEAFAECKRLVVVTFSDELSEIGRDAFRGTFWMRAKLKTKEPVTAGRVLLDASNCKGSVRISDEITAIAPGAFSGNTEVTDVRLHAGITEICEGAFSGCTGLTRLVLPEGITEIPAEMCAGCTALTAVSLPESLKKIGAGAFRETALVYLSLPESITGIEPETFSGCKALINLTGKNVAYVGARAFAGCSQLCSADGGWSIEDIGEEAFADCTEMQSLSDGSLLRIIGTGAFRNCTKLRSVVLSSSVAEVGQEAFAGCTALETATVYSAVTVFGTNVFPNQPELLLFGYGQTTAEQYAEENGLKFSSLGEIMRRKPGDISGDGAITLDDAQLVLKIYTERLAGRAYSLPDALEIAADVDEDGELTVTDAQYILRFYTESTVAHKAIDWIDILNKE